MASTVRGAWRMANSFRHWRAADHAAALVRSAGAVIELGRRIISVFPLKRLAFIAILLVLLGAGLAYAFRLSPATGRAAVSLNGVPLDSGSQEVPPRPTLVVTLPSRATASDYRATIDGRTIDLESKASGSAELCLPRWRRRPGTSSTCGDRDLAAAASRPARSPSAPPSRSSSPPPGWSGPRQCGLMSAGRGRSRMSRPWRRRCARRGPRWSAPNPQSWGSGARPQPGRASPSTSPQASAPPPARTWPSRSRRPSPYPCSVPTPTSNCPKWLMAAPRGWKLQAYYVATAAGLADLGAHARQINVLTPDFYGLGGDGHLYSSVDTQALKIAHSAGIEVQPLVTNLNLRRRQGARRHRRPHGSRGHRR